MMQICTCLPLHCESMKMNAESRIIKTRKSRCSLQHFNTHNNVQKSTNMVTEMKKCRHIKSSGRKLCKDYILDLREDSLDARSEDC